MPYSSRQIQGGNLGPGDSRAANPSMAATDGDVAFLIKYIGDSESGLVDVVSDNIVYVDGVVGSEDSAAGTDSALIGASIAGSIDVSDGGENTVAEVLPLMNVRGWIAVAVDCVGSDIVTAASLTEPAGAQQAKVAQGMQIFWNSSTLLKHSVLVAPASFRNDIRVYQTSGDVDTGAVDNMQPFKGTAAFVSQFNSVGTGTGADTVVLLEDTDPTSATGSSTVFTRTGAGTTVRNAIDLSNSPFEGSRGARLLAVNAWATTLTAGDISVQGSLERKLN